MNACMNAYLYESALPRANGNLATLIVVTDSHRHTPTHRYIPTPAHVQLALPSLATA